MMLRHEHPKTETVFGGRVTAPPLLFLTQGCNLQKRHFYFPPFMLYYGKMNFMEETMENILALILPVLIAILVFKFLFSQAKRIWKIIVNSASGFICLWLLNLASGLTGIVFEINFFTALLVGFLGIPGIILLMIGQLL